MIVTQRPKQVQGSSLERPLAPDRPGRQRLRLRGWAEGPLLQAFRPSLYHPLAAVHPQRRPGGFSGRLCGWYTRHR